jgi:hypothetical protein
VGPSINSQGVIHTANFIGCSKPEYGIPRFITGRAILEAKSYLEAIQIAGRDPKAFPWHHNIASVSNKEYFSVETLPDGTVSIQKPESMIYIHTNHLIGENTRDYKAQGLDKQSSTVYRYDFLNKMAINTREPLIKPDMIFGWLSSHENSPLSVCRHPQHSTDAQTLATAFFDLERASMKLYKGNPCESFKENRFIEYYF